MLTDFKLPDAVKKIIRLLNQHHFEAFLVGGCVRDFIIGTEPHDYDITTSALPMQMLNIFSSYTVIPTGLKHGTITVIADNIRLK